MSKLGLTVHVHEKIVKIAESLRRAPVPSGNCASSRCANVLLLLFKPALSLYQRSSTLAGFVLVCGVNAVAYLSALALFMLGALQAAPTSRCVIGPHRLGALCPRPVHPIRQSRYVSLDARISHLGVGSNR